MINNNLISCSKSGTKNTHQLDLDGDAMDTHRGQLRPIKTTFNLLKGLRRNFWRAGSARTSIQALQTDWPMESMWRFPWRKGHYATCVCAFIKDLNERIDTSAKAESIHVDEDTIFVRGYAMKALQFAGWLASGGTDYVET